MKIKYLMVAAIFSAVFILQACATTASANVYQRNVETHPSQGDVRTIEGVNAQFSTTENGISVALQTKELTPGSIYTMWVVIVNAPEKCAQRPCVPADVQKNTAVTRSDITYGDGILVGPDGAATFRTFIPKGTSGYWWYGNGLQSPVKAEIHLILNDHGPLVPELAQSMLTSYRGGCTDESIPAAFPATAKADGTPGPYQCKFVQRVRLQQ